MARPSMAKGARLGGGEVVRAGRRTLCAGQKRGPAGQGERDAAEAAGAFAAQTARHAQESAEARSTTVAHRRGEKRSGPRLRLREDSAAGEDEEVTRDTFTFHTDKAKLKAAELRDGHYLLRSNLTGEDPAVLWTRYVQLTQIESVFRSLKSELGIRPIYHQLEHRADAHVLIAFLAYCLQVTLKNRLMIHAPGLTPLSVFEKLSTIQMVEVWIPMLDGRNLVLPRHTHQSTLLEGAAI